MHHVTLPDGEKVPALGLGTWRMGEDPDCFESEVAVLRAGLDRGLTLIDTAEMYGEGGAERVVGAAIASRRDDAYLVSKVYPHNASFDGVQAACERSLERLGTDRLDIYLLHWRGQVPLEETIAGFEQLKQQGKIRHWGVSNLDADAMAELAACKNGGNCATNQLLYNLRERGIEWDIVPALQAAGMPVMAYCPLGEGRLLNDDVLADVANRHAVTPASVALAWLLSREQTITIPKTARLERLDPILAALDVELSEADLATLETRFPAPLGPTPLAIS